MAEQLKTPHIKILDKIKTEMSFFAWFCFQDVLCVPVLVSLLLNLKYCTFKYLKE